MLNFINKETGKVVMTEHDNGEVDFKVNETKEESKDKKKEEE